MEKTNMKKALKITGKILLIILALVIVFLLGLFIYHRVMLKSEDKLLESYPGQLVEVDGHNMNVYVGGEGEHTLVFLAPAGDTSPALTFKPLYSRLSGEYKTAVVEKFGYGMSDVVDTERDYKVMVDECREALKKSGVEAPYILCPYSKSGVDTLIWAQEYPDEVEAVISVDMGFPGHYDNVDTDIKDQSKLIGALREMGIARLFTGDSAFKGMDSKEDIAMARALVNRKFGNKVSYGETKTVKEALVRINSKPKPNVPMKLFISTGEGTGMDEQTWRGIVYDYTEGMSNAEYTELDCTHNNICTKDPDRVCDEIRAFTAELDK